MIGGFCNAIAVDYAAFVRRETRSQAVLVAEEGIRALAGGVRSLSLEECSSRRRAAGGDTSHPA